MFEVNSQIGSLKITTVCNSLREALNHARYLQCLYYGPSTEILGSNPEALIWIKPV